jgi:hypothetical protein
LNHSQAPPQHLAFHLVGVKRSKGEVDALLSCAGHQVGNAESDWLRTSHLVWTSRLSDPEGGGDFIVQARHYRWPKRHNRGVVCDKPEHLGGCRLHEDIPCQTKLPASFNLSKKRVQLVE